MDYTNYTDFYWYTNCWRLQGFVIQHSSFIIFYITDFLWPTNYQGLHRLHGFNIPHLVQSATKPKAAAYCGASMALSTIPNHGNPKIT
jgi:hypothetical protein